ncbi:hypothetical protein [Variovorax rhizosphaerae]|uniref:Uncharacterized protein n=1 Tax=Variovorax rhizosphaerae TaxID=1836200 RepID=A0ABU8WY42_9BURK
MGQQTRLNCVIVMVSDETPDDIQLLDPQLARVLGDPPRERAVAILRVSRADLPAAMPAATHLLDQPAGLLR